LKVREIYETIFTPTPRTTQCYEEMGIPNTQQLSIKGLLPHSKTKTAYTHSHTINL